MPDRSYLSELNRASADLASAEERTNLARENLTDAEKVYKASFADIDQMKFNNTIDEIGIPPSDFDRQY